jgi:hypothetical protein
MSPASRFKPRHVDRTGELTIPLPPGHVFPLFSPEGERAWVEDWDPEYLHPEHPSNAPGTVFRTTHGGEETVWLVLRYDPAHALAEYARFSSGSRLGTVLVQCREGAPGTTQVSVTYSLTSLSPAGNAVLAALTPAHYSAMLHDWQKAIIRSQHAGPG